MSFGQGCDNLPFRGALKKNALEIRRWRASAVALGGARGARGGRGMGKLIWQRGMDGRTDGRTDADVLHILPSSFPRERAEPHRV